MEKTKILTASFIDILFEGRNKEYGAYELRTTYEKRLWLALAITAAICFVFAGIAYVQASITKNLLPEKVKLTDITITDIKPAEKIPPPKPVEPPKLAEAPKIKTVALVMPKIVKDIDVTEPPPSQTDMADAKISNITQAGIKDIGMVVLPKSADDNKGIIDIKKAEVKNDEPFVRVEIDAKYPGGNSAWKNFLERNLRGEVPVENGANAGTYTVIIQFIVDKAGNVSDLKALTSLGYGMEAEALRVLKKSGKWIPAIQNGEEVKAYRKQPITFQVLEN